MSQNGQHGGGRKRRWFQYGLSTLLMLMVACAIAARCGKHWWDQRHLPATVRVEIKADGTIGFGGHVLSFAEFQRTFARDVGHRENVNAAFPVVQLIVSPNADYRKVVGVCDILEDRYRTRAPADPNNVVSYFVSGLR